MKHIAKYFLRTALPALGIVFAVLFSVNSFSCRSPQDGLICLNGDYSVPKIQEYRVLSPDSLSLSFSSPVSLADVEVCDDGEKFSSAVTFSSDGKDAIINFNFNTETGKEYLLEGTVSDERGNSLTFSLPFKGYNSQPAKLLISEVRNAYGTTTSHKVTTHKTEFAEFYVLEGGNLSSLSVMSAADGKEKSYDFPLVEVQKGEYITVHMRRPSQNEKYPYDTEGLEDETGTDLTLSTHTDSCETGRDLWSLNEKSVFADSDIIFLYDNQEQKIVDSLLFAKSGVEFWPASFSEWLSLIEAENLWQNEEGLSGVKPDDAVCSDDITSAAAGRSFSRQNIAELSELYESGQITLPFENSKNVWLITADSGSGSKKIYGVTPGLPNSDAAYNGKN
ncbi:MAG: hypothetical protein J5780_05435 [Treponema sp.]|nr:hypothetical protein [Treponema sp.]